MKSKKKLVITLSIAGAIILILGIALVAVLAAFSTTTTSSFTVGYTAQNVKATITAHYAVVDVSENSDDSAAYTSKAEAKNVTGVNFSEEIGSHTFTGTDNNNQETASGEIGSVDANKCEMNKNQITFIKFTITNNDTVAGNNIYVQFGDNTTAQGKKDNVDVYYSTNGTVWTETFDYIADDYDEIVNGTPYTIFVKVVIKNRTQDAKLDGAQFTINLTVDEPAANQ